jgi:hypothetical protein
MPENEESFEFVDKRRTSGDTSPEKPRPRPADDAELPPTQESDARGEPHPRLAAADRLLMCIDILHQGAWIALGLVTDPVTNQIQKDLGEARSLIDATAALAEHAEAFVEEPVKRELRNLVATLRMNFVNQSAKA